MQPVTDTEHQQLYTGQRSRHSSCEEQCALEHCVDLGREAEIVALAAAFCTVAALRGAVHRSCASRTHRLSAELLSRLTCVIERVYAYAGRGTSNVTAHGHARPCLAPKCLLNT